MKTNIKIEILGSTLVFLLPIFVFWGYLTGVTAPPWDFFGDYFTQAYSWWDLGNFFKPATYLPYLVSGFPAHLGLQVSSYYLPVGLIAEYGNYTILNAARLQAFTIAIGLVGVFVLTKKFDLEFLPRILVSVAYLFSAGFFSNASHIDIVRAWSFFPWLLFFLFPLERKKYWSIPLIVLVWFQFLVGAYPGNLASFSYLIFIFILVILTIFKIEFKKLLNWYLLTIFPGILLSSIKWIPFLLTGNGPVLGNQVKVNSGILATIFFPYGGTGQSGDIILPNDLTQRTFFVIPLILILAFFAGKNIKILITGITLISFSIILGIDLYFFPKWQEILPLLDISRFRTIDFKPGISLGVALLAGSGFQNLITFNLYELNKSKLINLFLRFTVSMFFVISIFFMGYKYDFSEVDNKFTIKLVLLSLSALFILIVSSLRWKYFFAVSSIVLSVYLGLSWANYFKSPWQVPRVGTENLYFGSEVSSLISNKKPIFLKIREPRVGPNLPIPYPGEMIIQFWNANELKRSYSTGGYVTIKGEPNFNKYIEYAMDAKYSNTIKFLSDQSKLIFLNENETNIDSCIAFQSCTENKVEFNFESYSPGSIIVSTEKISKNYQVVLNEIGWRGWNVRSCNELDICQRVKVGNQENNLLLNSTIPKGTVKIIFEYNTPFLKISFIIFYLTLLSLTSYLLYLNYFSKTRL